MHLSPGSSLGQFEISGLIGVGGMGEVYRARDTKLGREVAIKVLPEDLGGDPARLARFRREAQVLASLDHPHIGALHDFQESDGLHFLVLQLIEGETLAHRIARGPVPVKEALRLFIEIAGALQAAHARGVVHRDLKPANIKITPDGKAKVLDFGMAKSLERERRSSATATTIAAEEAPTKVTAEGSILGTPSYMSPQQARGQEVDARADIWAFGCCLYESLTGRSPFRGETVADVVAAILERDPDWSRVPPGVPKEVRSLLRRSLVKDQRRRLNSAHDISITLEEALDGLRKPSARSTALDDVESSRGSKAIEKIAVLPFDNLMGDPEQEYFVDGMTETLVAQLAKIKGMRVISRTSAMQYKKTDKPIPVIARELGVDALVEGSILRAGNDVRITAQLVHGWTDEHLWADSYDGKLENILSLQTQVALDIAKEVQIAVSPEDARRMLEQHAIDPAVHEAVLQGRFHWNKRTKNGFEQAVEQFQRAIEIDQDYAPARAGLADTYTLQANYGHRSPVEIMPLAKMEAERAIELDPTSAQGFASLAKIEVDFEWDWAKGEELYLRAIELDPDYPTAHHWYSDFLRWVAGRSDDALAEASLAYQLDPLSPIISFVVADAHEYRRDFGRAIEQYQKTLDMHPNFTHALMSIVGCYLHAGDYESARPYLERLRATRGRSAVALMTEARVLAAAGKKEKAARFAAEALQKLRTTDLWTRMLLAVAFWELGDDKKAFELLDQGVKERTRVAYLPAAPWFDPMRGDPRFQAILDEINFPPLPPDHPVAILAREREEKARAKTEKPIEKIAVLPFDNLMGDPEQEYFVDGMTETLVAQLAKIKGMRVMSRTSAMQYKKTDKPIPVIARELGVDALVEGSILRAGNDLRITAQLVHGWTDEHLWANSYDGKLENILSLQSEVALDIAQEIQIAVSPDDARRMREQRIVDPEAHEAVLKGRFHWNKRTKDGFEQAVEQFQRAIDVDPDYAPAHSGLADTYALQAFFGHIRPLEITPLAKMEAERAIQLDPTSAQGFASLGRIAVDFEWDWDKAEELYLRAIELDPDYPTAHQWYSEFLYQVAGRLDEGLAEASLAYQLDPLSPVFSAIFAEAHQCARDFAKAIKQNQNTLDMHPNFWPALVTMMRFYLLAGDYESARPYLERLRAIPGRSTFALTAEARFLIAAGKKDEAGRISAEALHQAGTADFFTRMSLAVAFWEVGDDKKAFELLNEAVKERARVVYLAADPWFDPMRGDARFQAILDEINFPPLPSDHPVAILAREREEKSRAKTEKPIEKIAVLPFDNLMGDPEQEYFVDGMTETLVAQLAKIKGMRVVSRTSAMHYKNTDKPIPIIARELGVDALVEGSILRAGNDLRITAQLVHGWTDEHLWADSYDGHLENILALQSEVALDIAHEIHVAVSAEDAQRLLEQRAVDPAVHEAVLQGRFHWNKRTKRGFEQAVEQFQRAIDVDPDYAPAHAGLADTYALQGVYGHKRPLENMPLAKIEAERAVELDPASAQGFASLGRIALDYEWDWEKAEELFVHAIELDPDYPTAHSYYCNFLYWVAGRLDEALAEISLAYQLDPLSPIISYVVADAHEFRREFRKAIEQNQHTLDMHPNFRFALTGIVRCHLLAGDYESARPHLEHLRATPGGSAWALMYEARFLAAAGKEEEATRSAAQALQKLGNADFFLRMFLPVAFWEVGDDKKAFELLSEAVKERTRVAYLAADPWFDTMRGDPRFQAILDEINFPPLPPDHPVAILAREREEKARAKTEKPIEKIAVLPFANISGDPEQEWFVDGMTEALITELAKIKALKVISRTSAMQYKNVLKPMQEIARELGVDALAEGSVMRVDNDVRVTAQLIRGATDSHLWAESYTGTLENILRLQGEIAMAIAKAIRVTVTPEEEKRITTAKRVDPEAYEAYLRGKFFFWKFTPDGYDKAIESFQRAVEIDPGFAQAHVLLGSTYWGQSIWGFVPPASAVERARPAIDTALALDDTLAGAHGVAGWIALTFDWDWPRAERELLRAIELDPGEPVGHALLSLYFQSVGRFDDAIRKRQEAIDLDPLNMGHNSDLAWVYANAGRYEEAMAQFQKVLELDPVYFSSLEGGSVTYILLNRYDEAVELIERGMAIYGRLPYLLGDLVWAHAAAGRRVEAETVLAEMHERDRNEYVGATLFAVAYAALGDMDEAFRWIDQALENRDYQLSLPYWPHGHLLRGDPRFLDVLRRINYPAISDFEAAIQNTASADTGQTPID